MKTLVLLLATTLITATAIAAADRNPTVTISNRSEYSVYIDDRFYSGERDNISLTNLNPGYHTVKVYRQKSGLFGGKTLVSSSSFNLRNNDVRINVSNTGKITLSNNGYANDRKRNDRWGSDRGRDDNDWKKKNSKKWKQKKNRGRDDNDWNRGRGKGNGRDRDWDDD